MCRFVAIERNRQRGERSERCKCIENDFSDFQTFKCQTEDWMTIELLILNLHLLFIAVCLHIHIISVPSSLSSSSLPKTNMHSLHQVAESRTAAVLSALCCPHQAPSVQCNFHHQQTGKMWLCFCARLRRPIFFHEWGYVCGNVLGIVGGKVQRGGHAIHASSSCNFTPHITVMSSSAPQLWTASFEILWRIVEVKHAINNPGWVSECVLDTAWKSIELCRGGKQNVHHIACTSEEHISLCQRTVCAWGFACVFESV